MKQGKLLGTAVLAALVGALACPQAGADKVYSWTDENGVRHFSQTPPPAEQPAVETEIATSPAATEAAADAEYELRTPLPAISEPPAGEEAVSVADRQRQRIAQERAAREQAEFLKEVECVRTRERLAMIQPRLAEVYVNDAGEAVPLDESHVAEAEELTEFYDRHCR